MYLITYDISSPKRLRRVAKIMEKFGIRVQKSVFECYISNERLLTLKKLIRRELNFAKDSVRFYSICNKCLKKIFVEGVGQLPENEDFIII